MSDTPIIAMAPLGMHWQTLDPFLFCAYHNDAYPEGNAEMGVSGSKLSGRAIGSDFSAKDGWSMYHGDVVPGFPRHPHRGFETITLARRGYIDHSDSLGATARFGEGDVQWMTAGSGIVHAEMFPLVRQDAGNHTELFQIWLNLPAASKMVAPHFSMLWSEHMPRVAPRGSIGTEVVIVAGALDDVSPPAPPPDSWASNAQARIVIWTIDLAHGANWTLPAASSDVNRVLYLFNGDAVTVAGQSISAGHAMQLAPDAPVALHNDGGHAQMLLLQGRPIGEPVAQHGPFVMNTQQQIREAMADYQRTGFGGWPWSNDGPVHPRDAACFARYPDGSTAIPPVGEAAQ